MGKDKEPFLFEEFEDLDWREHWVGMPEFIQEDLEPKFQVIVAFECEEDIEEFSRVIGQKVTPGIRGLWFPEAEIGRISNKRWIDESL